MSEGTNLPAKPAEPLSEREALAQLLKIEQRRLDVADREREIELEAIRVSEAHHERNIEYRAERFKQDHGFAKQRWRSWNKMAWVGFTFVIMLIALVVGLFFFGTEALQERAESLIGYVLSTLTAFLLGYVYGTIRSSGAPKAP